MKEGEAGRRGNYLKDIAGDAGRCQELMKKCRQVEVISVFEPVRLNLSEQKV